MRPTSPRDRLVASANRDLLTNLPRILRAWFDSIVVGGGTPHDPRRGRLLLESLERRQMLAGDVELFATDGSDPIDTETAATESTGLPVTTQAEGEPANDLVQFAKDLEAAGVQFFGAAWCPACTQQEELFEDGGQFLPFIEVTNPDRTLNSVGQSEGIEQFPTWEFPGGEREVGVLDLATLSTLSGVPIPQSEEPTFAELGSQTVRVGSPLHLPIDAYDPNGGPLTVTVSVDDPSLLEATVITGNRSLRVDVAGFGDMVFELFEQRAPRPAGRVADLAESGFYDGIIFHRVIDNFVLQTGDPTGTGTGGSELGNFDDQFHPDLQHNRSGVLSFAKTNDDTNNSQFFITEVATRHLDFNHSIFGQLVEGEAVREAISNMEVDDSDRPTTDITIEEASVFDDTENSVIMLKALGGTGQTDVTVTVTDEDGNTHTEVMQVEVTEDTGPNSNSQPYLEEIATPDPVPADTPATLQLSSIDIEGDPVRYLAQMQSGEEDATVTVDATSGLVTVTPEDGFTGEVDVIVAVQAATDTNDFDSQIVTFSFEESSEVPPPTSLDLDPDSDTGASDSDNITRAGTLKFEVEGVTDGAEVEIVDTATGSVVGVEVASGSSVTITTSNIASLGDGTYVLAARQRIEDETSELSPTLTLTYDSTRPASVLQSAARFANVGRDYSVDLINAEEGDGLVYAFETAPNGASIDATTGEIEWTPTTEQLGNNTFTLELTDAAGNVRTESFTVAVGDEPLVGIRLELTDSDGNPVSSLDVGDEFLLRMYGVDNRNVFDRRGVFAAHADILFNSDLVRAVPGTSIEYPDSFDLTPSGSISTGLIDEVGAVSSSLDPSDEDETLVATIRMEAIESGGVNFRSEPHDGSGEVLLFLRDDEVPTSEIEYGTVALAIGFGFQLTDDEATVIADAGPTTIDVLDNDEILSGDGPLTVVSVTQPQEGGSVELDGDDVIFTPDPEFEGTTTFTYRVRNPAGAELDATVAVTVAAPDEPPVGVADSFTVVQNSDPTTLDVLDNDSPSPGGGETLAVTAVSESTEGATVEVGEDGASVRYTPPTDFTGIDEFTYTLSDGALTTEVTVTVTVTSDASAPVANADAFTIEEDTAEAAYDVLDNDDPNDLDETFVLDSVGTPTAGGTARVSDDGTQMIYAPAANFNGTEEVTYSIRSEGGGIASATVTFTVTPVNDDPPAADRVVTISTGSGERVVHRLQDLPENVDDGETLEFVAVGESDEGGTVRIADDGGSIFYTPPSGGFTGTDSFAYTVEDDAGLTSEATLTIQVTDFTQRSIRVTMPGGSSNLPHLAAAITLTGTNDLGETVERTLSVGESGASFDELYPGSYTLRIAAIPFLQNAEEPREISIESDPDDGDTEIDTQIGRLRPEYLSVRDFLGSSKSESILAAIAPGSASLFAIPSSTVDDVESPVVEMSDDGSEVTVRGTNGADGSRSATFSTDVGGRVQLRGRADDLRLLRIQLDGDPFDIEEEESDDADNGSADATNVATQSLPLTNPSGGEGEAASSSFVFGESQADGDSDASDAVTLADVFVPPTRDPEADPIVGGNPDANTDAAMADVAPGLSVRSESAESLADLELLEAGLPADAIDAALLDG